MALSCRVPILYLNSWKVVAMNRLCSHWSAHGQLQPQQAWTLCFCVKKIDRYGRDVVWNEMPVLVPVRMKGKCARQSLHVCTQYCANLSHEVGRPSWNRGELRVRGEYHQPPLLFVLLCWPNTWRCSYLLRSMKPRRASIYARTAIHVTDIICTWGIVTQKQAVTFLRHRVSISGSSDAPAFSLPLSSFFYRLQPAIYSNNSNCCWNHFPSPLSQNPTLDFESMRWLYCQYCSQQYSPFSTN